MQSCVTSDCSPSSPFLSVRTFCVCGTLFCLKPYVVPRFLVFLVREGLPHLPCFVWIPLHFSTCLDTKLRPNSIHYLIFSNVIKKWKKRKRKCASTRVDTTRIQACWGALEDDNDITATPGTFLYSWLHTSNSLWRDKWFPHEDQ